MIFMIYQCICFAYVYWRCHWTVLHVPCLTSQTGEPCGNVAFSWSAWKKSKKRRMKIFSTRWCQIVRSGRPYCSCGFGILVEASVKMTTIYQNDIHNAKIRRPESSCILHHPASSCAPASWIILNPCQGLLRFLPGPMRRQRSLPRWVDVVWCGLTSPKGAEMREDALRSAECVRLKKMLYSDILAFGHSKKYSCFTHLCFGLLWTSRTFWNLLEPFGTFWNPCQALSQLGLPVWPSARKGSLLSLLSRLSLLWWTEWSEWILRCHRWASDISGTDTSKNDKSMVRMNKSGTVCTVTSEKLIQISHCVQISPDFDIVKLHRCWICWPTWGW